MKIIGYIDSMHSTDTTWQTRYDWSKVTSVCFSWSNAADTSGNIEHGDSTYNSSITSILHSKGCRAELILSEADAILGTIADNGGTALSNLATNLTNWVLASNADGLHIDWEYDGITNAQMNNLITALYNALHPHNKTLSIYYGNYLVSTPKALVSSDVANSCLWYISIGVYYNIVTATAAETAMAAWSALYNKSLLVCTKAIGIWDNSSNKYCGIYSDLWDSHNLPAPATNVYSRYYSSFYANWVIDDDYPVGNNPIATNLTWDCVAQILLETQWIVANGYSGMGLFCFNYDLPTSNPGSLLQNIYLQVSGGGFIHGSVHTATFQVTKTPAGIACQVEVWLGPNATTKAATSGLVPFTSTGSPQAMALPVTMPAAGTYNVYKDIYVNGVLTDYVIDSPITVV